MISFEYRHVDVFSQRALGGNGLTVVLDSAPLHTSAMKCLTREFRQFETAFLTLVDLANRTARLRIFTEDEELDFAGHPVLGAAAVLHSLIESETGNETWMIHSTQRTLEVRTHGADEWVDATMDQGVPELGPVIPDIQVDSYLRALNLTGQDFHNSLPMQVVSTGLPYLIVPVQSGMDRAKIQHPNFEGLLSEFGAKFVYVLDPNTPEGRTWDNAGRVEDVATGSAAGPAAGYLFSHQMRPAGEPFLLRQGRFVGRPSTIEIRPDPTGRVWVGGPVAQFASGHFTWETS